MHKDTSLSVHTCIHLLEDSLEILFEGKSQSYPPEDIALNSRYKWIYQTHPILSCVMMSDREKKKNGRIPWKGGNKVLS